MAETDKDVSVCQICKNKIEHDYYYWEARDKIICNDCTLDPEIHHSAKEDDIFWRIIKTKKIK